MKKNQKIVFISIYCCLAIVLDYIKTFIPFLNMPSGGSINIALIPIVICSFHLGIFCSMICGLIWWILSSMFGLNPYFISIIQYLLDYIIPSVIVGIASIFYHKKNIFEIEMGIVIMMLIRTVSIVISGAIYWPGQLSSGSLAAWTASIVYNLPYSLATLIMLLIIIPSLLSGLKKHML